MLCLTTPCLTRASEAQRLVNDDGARRIIALYGAISDILIEMGLGDRLVARTTADIRPEMAHLPPVGTHMRPNIERIAALRPDLVIQFEGRDEAGRTVAQLRALGIRVEVLRGSSLEGMLAMITRLGELTSAPAPAERLRSRLEARLALVAEQRAGKPAPRIFFEIRSPHLLAAGANSMPDAIIRAAGGQNAVAHHERVVRLNEEELMRLNPDVYLMQRGPMNSDPLPLAKRPTFRALEATRHGRELLVDEAMFSRPAPDAVRAVEILADYLDNLDTVEARAVVSRHSTGGQP